MLNKIGDQAADKMLEFYQSHLDQGVVGEGEYEAHFNIALLKWRKYGQKSIKDMIFHFNQAAMVGIELIAARKPNYTGGRESLFNFMFPLLITYIFGDKSLRQSLSSIQREQWAPSKDDEYASLIAFFDLLRKRAVDRQFTEQEIITVAEANDSALTHAFYQPWITAFLKSLHATITQNTGKLDQSLEVLIDLHREEALYGTWSTMPEGLLGFWPLAAKITADIHGVTGSAEDEYVPDIDVQLIQ